MDIDYSNIIKSCKCGSDWTLNELRAYRIFIRDQPETDFFGDSLDNAGLQNVPLDLLQLDIGRLQEANREDGSYRILKYMKMASRVVDKEESAVDDFSAHLLMGLGYENMGIIRSRKSIKLLMCGTYTYAKTDICILDEEDEQTLLLLQEDKSHLTPDDPEPQLVAEAIAAFQHNNLIRRRWGRDELAERIFPCIAMVGSYPTFYKVKVTQHLSTCIEGGLYPNYDTVVYRFNPVPGYDSMLPVPVRQRVIRCFLLFKNVAQAFI